MSSPDEDPSETKDLGGRLPEGLAENKIQPYPWYARMREENPVTYHESLDSWGIFKYEDIQRVLSNTDEFQAAPEFSNFNPGFLAPAMIDVSPPDHTRLRSVTEDWFDQSQIQQWEPGIRELTRETVTDAVESDGWQDFYNAVLDPVATKTITKILGVPEEDWPQFIDWSNRIGTEIDPDMTMKEQRTQSLRDQADYFDDFIERRADSPEEDLVSVIATSDDLSHDEKISYCILILLAGQSTTRRQLANTVWTLAEEDDLGKLRSGEYSPLEVIEEGLRYRASTHASTRVAVTDVELRGKTIEEGDHVYAWRGSANHDEEVFENPEEFNPKRENRAHIAFGAGVHYCLGSHLARLEQQVVLEELIDNTSEITVATSDLKPHTAPFAYGPEKLPVKFD